MSVKEKLILNSAKQSHVLNGIKKMFILTWSKHQTIKYLNHNPHRSKKYVLSLFLFPFLFKSLETKLWISDKKQNQSITYMYKSHIISI